jgi:hypothetical protein
MGRNARISVEQRFSETSMIDRYEHTLKEFDIRRSGRAKLRKPASAY